MAKIPYTRKSLIEEIGKRISSMNETLMNDKAISKATQKLGKKIMKETGVARYGGGFGAKYKKLKKSELYELRNKIEYYTDAVKVDRERYQQNRRAWRAYNKNTQNQKLSYQKWIEFVNLSSAVESMATTFDLESETKKEAWKIARKNDVSDYDVIQAFSDAIQKKEKAGLSYSNFEEMLFTLIKKNGKIQKSTTNS